MADVTDSKSVGSNTVWVQVPPPAPEKNDKFILAVFLRFLVKLLKIKFNWFPDIFIAN